MMNRPAMILLFMAVVFTAFMSCTDGKKDMKNKSNNLYSAEISLSDSVFNFGHIAEREEPYSSTFTFINTGKVPAVVLHAVPSCRCTSVAYGREPVAAGDTGTITVFFDSKESGKGFFSKSVKLRFNSMKTYQVKVEGIVE